MENSGQQQEKKPRVFIKNGTFYVLKNLYEIELLDKGVNPKFWIRNVHGHDFIYKANRGEYDGIGEVLYFKLCKAVGYEHRCIVAKPATLANEDGSEVKGVLVPSYIKEEYKDKTVRVMSGRTLLNEYAQHVYDNSNGKKIQATHTLKTYLEMLEYIRHSNMLGENVDVYSNIERRLKFLALMDYVTCQSDRHWENIDFLLITDQDGNKKLKLAPFFDNGHVYNLHMKGDTPKMGVTYRNSKDKGTALKFFTKKYFQVVPMFGIQTPTYETKVFEREGGGKEVGIRLSKDTKNYDIFVEELAALLASDEELMVCYNKLKSLDFGQVLQDSFVQEDIPDGLVDAVRVISSQRMLALDQALEKQMVADELGEIEDLEDIETLTETGTESLADSSEMREASDELWRYMTMDIPPDELRGDKAGGGVQDSPKKETPKKQDNGGQGQ